jgi:mucin-19
LNSALGSTGALTNLSISATNIALNGASLTTLGDQTYNGSITLGAGTTMLATDANAVITTNGTVNSDGTARSLVLNASNTSGRVVVLSALGNTADLASLTVNATAIAMNGSGVNTTGSQSYSGNITLGNTVTARASGASAIITANNAINSDTAGARGLTLNASGNAGSVVVQSAVGNATALANLTVNANAIALNGSNITTSGNQSYTGAITLGAGTTLTGSNVTTTSTGSTIAGAGNSLAVVGNASIAVT